MEEGDFERLPDRGYARNMVRGYAHIVGLDQNLISQMYLEELHMFETGRPLAASADTHRQASQLRRSNAEGNRRSSSGNAEGQRRTSSRRSDSNNPRTQNPRTQQGSSRRVYEAKSTSSRSQKTSSARNSSRRLGSPDNNEVRAATRSNSARNDSMRAYRRPSQEGRSGRKSPSANVPLTSLFASNFGKRKQSSNQSARPGVPSVYTQNKRSTPSVAQPTLKMSFLVAVALVALIVIVLAIVFSSGSKQAVDEVPQIPISGLTDTSGSSATSASTVSASTSDNSAESSASTSAPSNEFTYTLDSGSKAWVLITKDSDEDNPIVEDVLEGPLTKTIEITESTTFKTANPDPITLKFNGEEVELTQVSGTEYYTYTATPQTSSAKSTDSTTSSSSTDSTESEE
jgi:hypothetical protein